ncbi:MAG TPA: phosphatase PAP2 family protein [Gemmataceae bacterium]|nr:phosphatase PAP2 family protein [Gemmataceae bacterium]
MLKQSLFRIRPSTTELSRRRFVRPCVEPLEERCLLSADVILQWNGIALDALKGDYALGHTPDQGGPTRDSRALAIVHAAMFDAVNSIDGRFTPYLVVAPNSKGASLEAAVAQAAHDTLVQLYPSQTATFDIALTNALAGIPNGQAQAKGIAVGQYVAAAILAARANDGSTATSDYHTIGKPGHHQPDPLHPDQGFLTPEWGQVTHFAVDNIAAYLSPPPPPLGSAAYAAAFNEVKVLGAADAATSDRDGNGLPDRSPEQTQIGIFWGYDGSPELGTPPREYNQIVRIIAQQQHNSVDDNARLFALVNLAMADGAIQCWDTKYVYDFWRPIIGIRGANTDGNNLTVREADWTPLGAPRSNAPGETNFTPSFPSYTSGHATFGGATFRTLADFYGRDNITFSFNSDEFNGKTKDQDGSVRPVVTRTFHSFSAAAEENGQSRIYLGIHWSFDKVQGIKAGNAIADFAFAHLLRPTHSNDHSAPPFCSAFAQSQADNADSSSPGTPSYHSADFGGEIPGQQLAAGAFTAEPATAARTVAEADSDWLAALDSLFWQLDAANMRRR